MGFTNQVIRFGSHDAYRQAFSDHTLSDFDPHRQIVCQAGVIAIWTDRSFN
jgi:hypothetical protein